MSADASESLISVQISCEVLERLKLTLVKKKKKEIITLKNSWNG